MDIGLDFLDVYSQPKIINTGIIDNTDGESVPYIIELGLSKSSIFECNRWKDFITNIIIQFVIKNPDLKDYKTELQKDIMLEDYHWDWSKKAFVYNTIGYDWFFLKTDDGVQGVCLTFHPKESVFQRVDIFYIQYLSSAPWNRKSSLHKRQYRGIGNEILKQVQFYFLENHHYSYGFCLHSLPQSQTFYEQLGMKNFPEYNDVDGLLFYEMSKESAFSFLEVKNG
jgi:hypothetical protein